MSREYNISPLLNRIDSVAKYVFQQPGEDNISFNRRLRSLEQLDELVPPDDLIKLVITATGGQDCWSGSTDIEYGKGCLNVYNTEAVHSQISDVLSAIRRWYSDDPEVVAARLSLNIFGSSAKVPLSVVVSDRLQSPSTRGIAFLQFIVMEGRPEEFHE